MHMMPLRWETHLVSDVHGSVHDHPLAVATSLRIERRAFWHSVDALSGRGEA